MTKQAQGVIPGHIPLVVEIKQGMPDGRSRVVPEVTRLNATSTSCAGPAAPEPLPAGHRAARQALPVSILARSRDRALLSSVQFMQLTALRQGTASGWCLVIALLAMVGSCHNGTPRLFRVSNPRVVEAGQSDDKAPQQQGLCIVLCPNHFARPSCSRTSVANARQMRRRRRR